VPLGGIASWSSPRRTERSKAVDDKEISNVVLTNLFIIDFLGT
jgi:hypothetical protein